MSDREHAGPASKPHMRMMEDYTGSPRSSSDHGVIRAGGALDPAGGGEYDIPIDEHARGRERAALRRQVPEMDFLLVRTPDGSSYRHEIAGATISIGRSRGNDLALTDMSVSSRHAEISGASGTWFIRDLGAHNGTFVNGNRIRETTVLSPGDEVRVGGTVILFDPTGDEAISYEKAAIPVDTPTTAVHAVEISTPPLPLMTGSALLGEEGRLPQLSPPALSIMLEADRELAFNQPIAEILNTTMDLVARAVPLERGLLMLRSGGALEPHVVRLPPGAGSAPFQVSRAILDRVLGRRESILTGDALADGRFEGSPSVSNMQLRSMMCVPLQNRKEVLGLIYVDDSGRSGSFTHEHLVVLSHLAAIAAAKIDQRRLFEREVRARYLWADLRRAAEIQRKLLPERAPAIAGYQCHGVSIPCLAVGGDAYDYIPLGDGRLGIGLADVAGKGLSSALVMCCFHSSLRAVCRLETRPQAIVIALNELLLPRLPENRYVTFFFGVLDPVANRLTYVNAAHEPPILVRRGAGFEMLSSTGLPVGALPEASYEVGEVGLGPGDAILCYSDGVTELRDPAGAFFGRDRLADVARAARDEQPDGIIRRVREQMEVFQEGHPQEDDVTLVALKRVS